MGDKVGERLDSPVPTAQVGGNGALFFYGWKREFKLYKVTAIDRINSCPKVLMNFSFVKVFPHTGRTHQIRVHFSFSGNPILGDKIYGNSKSFERLALHAYSVEFHHPIYKNLITSYSTLPEIFRKYIQEEFLKQQTSIK